MRWQKASEYFAPNNYDKCCWLICFCVGSCRMLDDNISHRSVWIVPSPYTKAASRIQFHLSFQHRLSFFSRRPSSTPNKLNAKKNHKRKEKLPASERPTSWIFFSAIDERFFLLKTLTPCCLTILNEHIYRTIGLTNNVGFFIFPSLIPSAANTWKRSAQKEPHNMCVELHHIVKQFISMGRENAGSHTSSTNWIWF